MFSVGAGLACGKEGPMVHIGAGIAAGLGQGKSTSLPWINTRFFQAFRNDLDKRECGRVE
jgi:chloride channel 7